MKFGSEFKATYVLVENTDYTTSKCILCCFNSLYPNYKCPKDKDTNICNVVDKGKNPRGDAFFKIELEEIK